MLNIIIDYIKHLPKTLINVVTDIFKMILDVFLWCKDLVVGISKITVKILKKIPTMVSSIGKGLIFLITKLPIAFLMLFKGIFGAIIKIPYALFALIKLLGKMIVNLPNILISIAKALIKGVKKIPTLLISLGKIIVKIPVMILKGIIKAIVKIGSLFKPLTKGQRGSIIVLIALAIFGMMIQFGKVPGVKFDVPQLVEGPKMVLAIPLPAMMAKFPWAIDIGNGKLGLPITTTVVTTWVIMAVIFIILKIGTHNLKIVPGKFQCILESIYTTLEKLVEQMMGSWEKRYFSYISTLMIFLIFSNIITFFPVPSVHIDGVNRIISIAPAFRAPTADLNTTGGMALLTAIIFTAVSLETNGFRGYVKGYLSPIFVMAPLNVISELAKPVSIALRLFGNMFAGMVIMGLLYMATTRFGILATIVAPLHIYFDLFSGVIQGFIFAMLTMVYISGSYGDRKYEDEIAKYSK